MPRGRLPVVPDGHPPEAEAQAGPRSRRPTPLVELRDPLRLFGDAEFTLRMMGIGGTGVVTVSQVIGVAALIDGLHVAELDQTGLSQKGGPVVSDMRISREPLDGLEPGLAGGRGPLPRLRRARRGRTRRTSPSPTRSGPSPSSPRTRCRRARWSLDPKHGLPGRRRASSQTIDVVTRREHNVYLDAQRLSRAAVRRPHAGEHARARRRVAARRAAALAVGDRGGDPPERRRASRRTSPRSRGAARCVADPEAVADASCGRPEPERAEGLEGAARGPRAAS